MCVVLELLCIILRVYVHGVGHFEPQLSIILYFLDLFYFSPMLYPPEGFFKI